ncbi:MAG: histidine ammonia-lyase [Saprospiraceae bacterium]|nr:histidine ammonia-lyase [Saprospiraceae bacterium]
MHALIFAAMLEEFILKEGLISLKEIIQVWTHRSRLILSDEICQKVLSGRNSLDQMMSKNDLAIYGVNTGFGSLCNQVIPDKDLDQLQVNLVKSHACGTGEPISKDLTRLVMLLKIISLSKGNSAIRLSTLEFLVKMYNEDIIPVIPRYGSLGASGDLAPLAHLSLPFIGEGKIWDDAKIRDASLMFRDQNIIPCGLKAKEGLALLNGTQYSLALLLSSLHQSENLMTQLDLIASLSMEAFNCSTDFLHEEIHLLRNQKGQILTAEKIRNILHSGELASRIKQSVQDPYSFRCIPQVHGATRDSLAYIHEITEREVNAVTDNPLLLSDGEILSGGNFHAQPLALCADYLSIAMAEMGNISERRIYQLINGSRGLPDFLTSAPGLNSGYMIVQYSAAALVSINKQLASPSSVDSIVTSKGQEDHVSMAANAGLKCVDLVQNVTQILAMEWMTATRAWHFRADWKLPSQLQTLVDLYLNEIPFIDEDHIPSDQFKSTIDFLQREMGLS